MHDVLDPCDLVPDEAEQLLHSGYIIGPLLEQARAAAARRDFAALTAIADALALAPRQDGWRYVEPSDEASLTGHLHSVPRLNVDPDDVLSRLQGAWLGRCVGNTMGKPVEGLLRSEVQTYLKATGQWPQTGYLPLLEELPPGVSHLHESAPFASAGLFEDVPRDDDIDWTILGLHLMEHYGDNLTTEVIAREWLDRLPFTQTFTAERAAYRNLLRGLRATEAALVDNPYREWIGALIRGDIFGYVRPGDPGAAAALAYRDASLTHVGNGIYGELWAAGLVAAAFGTADPRVALSAALSCIPPTSRLAEAQREVLDLHATGTTVDGALAWVDERLGHYNWVHTINNAALISIGLLWGTDFVTSVAITISGGRDTDSNAATVGSVYGVLHGLAAIPESLVGTTHVRVSSAVRGFDRMPIAELASRTYRIATLPTAPTKLRQQAPTPVIIDTDPGLGEPGSDIDDGFAIAFALRCPELDVRALTIVNGNVDALTGLDVARRLCVRLGRPDLPILLGATQPLVRDMAPVHQLFDAVLADNPGLHHRKPRGPLSLSRGSEEAASAADFLVAEAARSPGELTIIAIGPMTNLAAALLLDPSFATNVKEFVVMAGSATTYAQNITTVGDFNIYVDPEAMDLLLRSGARVKMIGIDQTSQCLFSRDDAEVLRRSDDPFSRWAADCSDAWIDFLGLAFPKRPEHRTGYFLHDPLVVAAVVDPAICKWESAAVEIELKSELARGLAIADRNLALQPAKPANAVVATATDVPRFRRLFLDRIANRKGVTTN